MSIGFYTPYLHILGGGERYILSIAQILSEKHKVYLFGSESIIQKAKKTLDLKLDKISLIPLSKVQSNKNRLIALKDFDIFFYVTDGSVFFSTAKRNFLIVQSSAHFPENNIINRIKLSNWKLLCYSTFIQKLIFEKLKTKSYILPPCIDNYEYKDIRKEKVILSVGRFFTAPHDKKHALLVQIFKKNYQQYFSGWKLIIAGGLTEDSGLTVYNNLIKLSKNYPIEILKNITSTKLLNLYNIASLYWHGAGANENLDKYPEKAEHFGISILEAMRSGTVPLVYKAGGPLDIVSDGVDGYFWTDSGELVSKSRSLIKDHNLFAKLSERSIKKAGFFYCDQMYEKIDKIIKE